MDLATALALVAAKEKEVQRLGQEAGARASHIPGEAKAVELAEELTRVSARYAAQKATLELECEGRRGSGGPAAGGSCGVNGGGGGGTPEVH